MKKTTCYCLACEEIGQNKTTNKKHTCGLFFKQVVWVVFNEYGYVSGVFDSEEKAVKYCEENPGGICPYEKWEVK